jgi:flagellin-like hook-associated protein FlgL
MKYHITNSALGQNGLSIETEKTIEEEMSSATQGLIKLKNQTDYIGVDLLKNSFIKLKEETRQGHISAGHFR